MSAFGLAIMLAIRNLNRFGWPDCTCGRGDRDKGDHTEDCPQRKALDAAFEEARERIDEYED